MKLLILSPGQDIAGQGIRIKRAFDKFSDWDVRAMHTSETYIKYPRDLRFDQAVGEELYAAADVVHHNDRLHFYGKLGGKKPTVLHHHGSLLRDTGAGARAMGKRVGATELVSTVDLLDEAPTASWVPAPFDIDWLRDKYGTRPKRGPLRIGHAPTNRAIKSTDLIMEALRGYAETDGITPELIEGVQWVVCLSRKGLCDVYVDQLKLGYGCNTIECWAMGIPVIAGWEDPRDRERFLEQTGETDVPFFEATEANVAEKIGELMDNPQLRKEYGERGRAFAEKFHSEEAVVARLRPIYEATLAGPNVSHDDTSIGHGATAAVPA